MPQEGGSGIFIQSHQKILEQISSWQIFFWNKTFLGPTFFFIFCFLYKILCTKFSYQHYFKQYFFQTDFFSNLNFHRPIFSIFSTTFFWDQNFLAQKCFGPKRFGPKFHCRIVLTSLFQEKFSVEIVFMTFLFKPNFFDCILFWSNFCWIFFTKICSGPKTYSTQLTLNTNFLGTKNIWPK